MEIYASRFLSINKQNDSLIQHWTNTTLNPDDFKQELKQYLEFFKKVKPKKVLWKNENFNLDIPCDIIKWMEIEILKPQEDLGLRNLGFIVSKHTLAQLSVIQSLDSVKASLHPQFFIHEEEATTFFNKQNTNNILSNTNEITIQVEPKMESASIILDVSYNDLPHVIDSIENLKRDQEFVFNHQAKYNELTHKEIQILRLIVHGNSTKEVAIQLFIEPSTVATHRKNIIKKLGLKSSFDWFRFAKAFKLISV